MLESNRRLAGCLTLFIAGGACLFCILCLITLNLPAYLIRLTLPVAPDSNFESNMRTPIPSESKGFLTVEGYRSAHPWPDVAEFFKNEMRKQGWELTSEEVEKIKDRSSSKDLYSICMIFQRDKVWAVSIWLVGNAENEVIEKSTSVKIDTNPPQSPLRCIR